MDAQALPPTGAQFGKFRIFRKIGEGAFGHVYEAVLPGPMGFAKKVAIKKIRSQLVKSDPRFVQSLINEARIGGLLHHPNIVGILEFGQVDQHYYLAMEYIEGATLTEILDLCRERKVLLPRFVVVDLARQVCKGLHYAHKLRDRQRQPLNLIHRDLKPSNIIVDQEGVARILDFGIAKAASNLYHTTETGMVKGTPRYMSPEQISGEAALTVRSDIFSMGAVLYEMITGRVLFSAPSLPALVHKIMVDVPDYQLDAADLCFPGSRKVLERCLAKDPGDRYGSASQLQAALQEMGLKYPAEADMADVIERLLPALDRRDSIDIDDTEAFVQDSAAHRQYDPGSAGKPDLEYTPIPAVDPTSAGWDRFAEEFAGPMAEEEDTESLSQDAAAATHHAHRGPATSPAMAGYVQDEAASVGAPRTSPGMLYLAIGLCIGLAIAVGVLLVVYVFPPDRGAPAADGALVAEDAAPTPAPPVDESLYDIVHVFVASTPSGVAVAYLTADGEMDLGQTPLSCDVAVEKSRLGEEVTFVLRKPGYVDKTVHKPVNDGLVEMSVTLERATPGRPTAGDQGRPTASTPRPAPVEEATPALPATAEPATAAPSESQPSGGDEDGFKANPYD